MVNFRMDSGRVLSSSPFVWHCHKKQLPFLDGHWLAGRKEVIIGKWSLTASLILPWTRAPFLTHTESLFLYLLCIFANNFEHCIEWKLGEAFINNNAAALHVSNRPCAKINLIIDAFTLFLFSCLITQILTLASPWNCLEFLYEAILKQAKFQIKC